VSRLRRIDPRVVDWVLAVAFSVSAIVSAFTAKGVVGPEWLTALVASSSGAAAFVRRSRPVTAIVLWGLGIVVLAAWLTPPEKIGGLFFGLLLFPYVVGARVPARRALAAPATVIVAVTAVALSSPGPFVVGDLVFPAIFGAMFWLAGRVVRSRAELTAELHEAAVSADEQREADAQRAVADERRRIAREMHDVVAHSVSTMVIHAGGARRIVRRDPPRAAEAAELIERTGREALREMRHLLGVLHAGEDLAELAPQPSLHGLDGLVERSRGAGLPVTLRVEGERRELPSGLDLAAYRVVQEALTNALKHGGGSAEVLVRFEPDELRLEIADEGAHPVAAVRVAGSGHGLLGMRERVRVFGGELHTGPRPEGGFEVVARLPLHDADEAALAASAAGRHPAEVAG
jgi:signal transduction histidine kinase